MSIVSCRLAAREGVWQISFILPGEPSVHGATLGEAVGHGSPHFGKNPGFFALWMWEALVSPFSQEGLGSRQPTERVSPFSDSKC